MISIIIIIFLIAGTCSAQDISTPPVKPPQEIPKTETSESFSSRTINSTENKKRNDLIRAENYEYTFSRARQEESFDLFSSVGSNINFGGIWDRYTVINFTPQLDMKPADFISVYANHYMNCLIPLTEVKEYSKTLVIQTAAIMTVEGCMNLFFEKKNWIAQTVSFALKNIITNLFIMPSIENRNAYKDDILLYHSYYCSVKFVF